MTYRLLALAAVLATAVGCGAPAPTAKLSGRVTLGGQPVTNGVVVFLASDNSTHMTDILPDGRYEVAGVPYGSTTVSIQQSPPRPKPRPEAGTRRPLGEAKDAKRAEDEAAEEPKIQGPVVPMKYIDPRQSKLAVEVNRPEQEFSVELVP